MFFAPEGFAVPANLIEPDEKRRMQAAFRTRVKREKNIDYFDDLNKDLATRVIQAIHNQRDLLPQQLVASAGSQDRTRLLFPFVTNQSGFNTGMAISNTTADPFGSRPQAGVCVVYYYGHVTDGGSIPMKQTSSVIEAGEQLTFSLLAGAAGSLILA